MKIDYVVIASDDNPLYKDFYPIVAKKWFELGFKTYYINITDEESIIEHKWGIIHKMKPLSFVSTGFQSQVVRLYASKLVNAVLMMSDIDMLPINKEYYLSHVDELTDDNVLIYSGQPYVDVPYYPMCYVVSNSNNFIKYLDIGNMDFEQYCRYLLNNYKQAWNTDENFMYDKFQKHTDKLIIKKRDFKRRIDRSYWSYDKELIEKGFYIDSHMIRPYSQYSEKINKLIIDVK